MRLWTIQDKAAYEDLCVNNILRCNEKLADWLREDNFKRSYDWLVSEMKKRVGKPFVDVKYPIWAWYLLDGKNVKPDLRRTEFNNYVGEHYILEVEIPDNKVLLSDEETWHVVLNNGYLSRFDDLDAIEEDDKWFDGLPSNKQERVKHESWQNIFDKTLNPWKYVQSTFWELRMEQIVSTRKFVGKRKE
ncbi:hypothetical protein FACS1894187_15920 [Synergistales bacterium]|nr:hypothetical protein FACS1894187_15920 [Synergistales bacterium]